MAGTTVFVSTDIALQGADLVSGGLVPNVKKGVELFLLNNVYTADGPSVPGRGVSDVSILLRQGLDFLSKNPHEALGVAVGCKTPEIRKAYKKHALKYHPDKNPLTTPLFQLMSSAHDRLTDPTQRQKEERNAAAKNPKPKPTPAPPPAAPSGPAGAGPPPGGFPNMNNPAGGNPAQPRQTYDPKTNKWSGDAEWGKYQQPPSNDANSKAQEAARRKQYYDEILREQFKKAESDRKAKEYAAMREAAARQRAGAAAGAGAGANGAGAAGTAGSGKPADASSTPNYNYYNYQNPNMQKPYPSGASAGTAGTAAGANAAGNPGAYPGNPNYYNRPPPPTDAPTGPGTYAGRQYKPATDAKVNPQNVPQYGKIPSREGPGDGSGMYSKPGSSRAGSRGSETAHTATDAKPAYSSGAAAGAAGAGVGANAAGPAGAAAGAGAGAGAGAKYNAGIAGNEHNASSSNLRSGIKPNASRVPRPYGLRCLFVSANAAELEWVTSKYHRNSLLAELSWRVKEADMNASFKATWESASKLISSGKCRKKNLNPGATYEFRVRAVEELAGGLLGYRSDWSDAISITLLPDKTTYSTSTAPPPNVSPSHKGLNPTKSKFNVNAGKDGTSFPFPDSSASENSKNAENVSQPQPTQPAQPKVHTFERFSTQQKPAEPAKTNLYDHLNTEAKEKGGTPSDGRKSTSALPTKSNVYDNVKPDRNTPGTSSSTNIGQTKPSASTDSPLHEMTKINIDNVKRFPSNGLSGSGRNVWGPDSMTPEGTRSNTAKAKKGAGEERKSAGGGAAAGKKAAARDNTDLEVDEDIADADHASMEGSEVEDETNTVGVDEDSSSIHTSATKNAKAAAHKPSGESKGAPGKKPHKGEFEDFTIEVEDGSDDEEEESDIEDDEFEPEYEEMYTLLAPAAKVKAKKTASSANLGAYSHPVRAEPMLKSTIVGYLVVGTEVVACADAGNWLKVKIHKQPTRKNSMRDAENIVEWGWSLRADKNHEYLKLDKQTLPPLHHAQGNKSHESPAPKGSSANFKSTSGSYYTPSTPLSDKSAATPANPLANRSMAALPKYPNHHTPPVGGSGRQSFNAKDVPVWMELFDEGGHAYYFNEASGESTWDPPNWVEEKDPTTGAKYYVNLGNASMDPSAPLHSTWTKPAEFARLLRT